MKKSSVYHFIQCYVAPLEPSQYLQKKTKNKRDYFFHPIVSSSIHPLLINGERYAINEQHLSIFAFYNDNFHGRQTYHFTAHLKNKKNGEKTILHCFYNQQGTLCEVTLKKGETHFEQVNDKSVEHYAESKVRAKINGFNKQLYDMQDTLQRQIVEKKEALEQFNPKNKHELSSLIKGYRELIGLLEQFNFIHNDTLAGEQKLCTQILNIYQAKKAGLSLPPLIQVDIDSQYNEEAKEIKSAVISLVPNSEGELKTKPVTLDIIAINNKLAALIKKTDLVSLMNKRHLLKEKLFLIPSADFDTITKTYQQLNILDNVIRKNCFKEVLKGNVAAAQIIVKNKYHIDWDIYSQLILVGHETVFAILFEYSPLPVLLMNALMFVPSLGGSISFLLNAYHEEKLSFFQALLSTYHCDPNTFDLNNQTVLHYAARKGKIAYAEALVNAGADINAIAIHNPKTQTTISSIGSDASLKKLESKIEQNKIEVEKAINKSKTVRTSTPIMLAAAYNQTEMLEWLLDHKACPNICDSSGFNALHNACFDNSQPPLNSSILSLLHNKAGMSIDSISTTTEQVQTTPLFFACQSSHLSNVKLLVTQFDADPNIMLRALIKRGDIPSYLMINSFHKAITKQAMETVNFLLDQDVTPLSKVSLEKGLEINEAFGNIQIRTALQKNLEKLTLLTEATKALTDKQYKKCLMLCTKTESLKKEQCTENMLMIRYQAYLGLLDYSAAENDLRLYIKLLSSKAEQFLSLKAKQKVRLKIFDATLMLEEVHQQRPILSDEAIGRINKTLGAILTSPETPVAPEIKTSLAPIRLFPPLIKAKITKDSPMAEAQATRRVSGMNEVT